MSTFDQNPSPGQFVYQQQSYLPPESKWKKYLNIRIIIFSAVVLTIIGGIFFPWLSERLTGGVHDYGTYKAVDLKAMSSFDMDQVNASISDIPQIFRNLDGQEVLMTGEMWAPRSASDGRLGYFVLVYSRTKCCFNGPPLAQHFIDGNVVRNADVGYTDEPVRVWGKLHVFIRKDPDGVIKSIYHVDVDKVEPIDS